MQRLMKTPGTYHDGNGLYLVVLSQTSRTWKLRFMMNRQARHMGLGSADVLDLGAARRRAVEIRSQIALGIDPIADRSRVRAEAIAARKNQRTFDECVKEYIEHRKEGWRSDKHRAQWQTTLDKYASPTFGKLNVEFVGKENVEAAMKPIWSKRPETATRVLQRINRVLVWAHGKNYRSSVPSNFTKLVTDILPVVTKSENHLSACKYTEVGDCLQAVHASTASQVVRYAFEFTVLTAARSGETRGATWEEIDLDNRVWTIPGTRMKAGKEHNVPLSDRAVRILESVSLLRERKGLIFPAPRKGILSDMVFTQLLRRLGKTYTMHGFRSSFADWAVEQTNYQVEVREAALAHVVRNKVEAAYRRGDLFDKRVALMTDWERYLGR